MRQLPWAGVHVQLQRHRPKRGPLPTWTWRRCRRLPVVRAARPFATGFASLAATTTAASFSAFVTASAAATVFTSFTPHGTLAISTAGGTKHERPVRIR